MSSTNYVLRISNYHIHLMRCAARQLDGGTSPGALITNPFHIVHKLQEARRKVCSTTWNSYSTTWNGCFSTWNSYFTSWNAKVYYILLVLFLLFRAFASKLRFIELTLHHIMARRNPRRSPACLQAIARVDIVVEMTKKHRQKNKNFMKRGSFDHFFVTSRP